jgi:hypothetical protein
LPNRLATNATCERALEKYQLKRSAIGAQLDKRFSALPSGKKADNRATPTRRKRMTINQVLDVAALRGSPRACQFFM